MAKYTISGDNLKLLDASGNQIWPVVPVPPPVVIPPPIPIGAQPPAPVTALQPGASLASIQSALNAVPPGGSLVFPSMTIPGALTGKAGITLWANGVVNVGGTMNFDGLLTWTVRGKAPGQGFVFSGGNRLSAQNASNFNVGNNTFSGITSNGFNGSAIVASGASFGLVINNDFNDCMGNVVGMYNLDNMNFDGNHFVGCNQCFSIQEPTTPDTSRGRNMVWRRNTFLATQRACIEVGPANPGSEYFSGIIVENNFFDDFDCKGLPGTMLPISLVGQSSVNTLVKDNFVRKGSRASVNTPDFEYTVGTEFTGTGEMTGNVICNFRYNLLYQNGWNIHDNILFGTPENFTTNQPGITGTRTNNTIVLVAPVAPAQPARIVW